MVGLGLPELIVLTMMLTMGCAVIAVAWFFVKKAAAPSRYCPACGRGLKQAAEAPFCSYCGAKLA